MLRGCYKSAAWRLFPRWKRPSQGAIWGVILLPETLRLHLDAAHIFFSWQSDTTIAVEGPPLRGVWYETTAIPEIREQAAALARQVTAGDRLSQRPGSAA